MVKPSENLEISMQSFADKAEDLGIALRTKTSSRHLSSRALKCRKLRQKGNPGWQHSAFVHNTNNGISFVPNIKKFPAFLLLAFQIPYASCVDVHYRSPQNVAVNIGERVFMNCSSDDTVHPFQNMSWAHYPAHNSVPTFIFMGGKLSSSVTNYISIADSSDGHFNLEIKTKSSAEGKYECHSQSNDKTASALLIILAAGHPECIVKTFGEYSNITCSVQYFGDWAPTMEWIAMTAQTTNSISSYESYTSDQIVSANLVVPRNVLSRYKCIMKFNEQGRKTKTTATNVPDYEWMSPVFGLITLVVLMFF